MEINTLNYTTGDHPFPLFSTPKLLNQTPPYSTTTNLLFLLPRRPFWPLPLKKIYNRPKLSRQKGKGQGQRQRLPTFLAASSNPFNESGGGGGGFSWLRVSQRFFNNLGESVKKETGFDWDFEDGSARLGELVGRVRRSAQWGHAELQRIRSHFVPLFINWNQWERWKDLKNWEVKRIGVLMLYILVTVISCQGIYKAIRAPLIDRERRELGEAYMEALIPEPSPTNVRKFKKGLWRKTTPKGLKLKKFIEGPDGTLIHDSSYVGEDAWDDNDHPQDSVKEIIDHDVKLNTEDKKVLKEDLGISVENEENRGTWRERLQAWNEILLKDKIAEQLDSLNAQYVVEFDMKEVENSLRKDIVEKVKDTHGNRALWISKRWWRYRPKLPYTYFLQKLDSSEVAAIVLTEDLKRLYVTMKEGFPLEYIVDIPLDPYLFEMISSSGVEVDLLQKRQIHYFLKVAFALLPGILILWFIRESLMLLHITSRRFLYKKYNQLFDMTYAENFILPVGEVGETKSMYKEVVLGGDVWDLLDELMIYMGNPMQYYEKEVKFVRGVLLSGPPGTGKTLFARTLAKESGLPFVFASGAEFTDSEKSGAARINEMFSIARRNAPAFVFVDEIDAIAGRHARKDPRRRATFEALIAQLDGEKEKTGVDRFSLRQAVIFICATNRPDELDLEFVRPGRIDRRLYIGLPDAKQRVQIFGVHSAGKRLAEDIAFEKLVFRTVGYSGADIRNLVNEAGIMSVRKGHSKISQQDIIDVLDKQLLEGMGVLLTEEEQQKCEQSVSFEKKRLLAVHEAGHIVLAHLFPRFDWHAFSQLLPGGKETALSVFYPREDMVDQGYTTFGYMTMQMVVAHGGRCAERIVFGDDITDGGQDDLERITKIAREMVISPRNPRLGLTALTKRLGLIDRPDNPDGELIKYKDFLEDLWARIQDFSSAGWKLESVPRPHLAFEPQLVAGKSHDFGPISCPEQPNPSAATSGISYARERHEAESKYPQRIRRLNIFPASKAEDLQPIDRFVVEEYLLDVLLFLNGCRKECAAYMAGLPVPFRYEYLMAETIFSQLLLLPEPPFKPIYYTLVIIDLCKALPGAFPAVVAGAVRALFEKIADLDMECRTRLILWFSHHLSNFQFIWPWEEWAHVLDLPKWAPQRVFVQEVLEREVRLSYWDKIKQSIENAPALEELLPPKGGANFKYNGEDVRDRTEQTLSLELNNLVKGRQTAREIITWVEESVIPVHGLDIALRVVAQTLLDIGSKSFTHLITVLERYGQVIAKICPDQDRQIMLIAEVSSYWKNNTQMTAITIDRMMGYRLLSNLAVVRWVFSSSNVDQFHISDRPWEILRYAVSKTYNRICDLRTEISSMERSVLLAEEAATKARAELETAESKLTLMDGEPVLGENPVRMKRLKSNADKAKEEEITVRESLEAKEALLARAIEENEALFLSLYKSFSNVLAEPLREAFKDGNLQPSDHVDEMAIDLEGSSAMELDKQNAKPKKSHSNGRRAGNVYNLGEREQWCLSTLGYVKAITRQYASEIWSFVEKLDADVLTEDAHPLLRKAIYGGLRWPLDEM